MNSQVLLAGHKHIGKFPASQILRLDVYADTRSNNEMELITRATIYELEGEEGSKHLEEYSDPTTERGKSLRRAICEKLHFSSLEFQTLEGLVESIGIDSCKLCTYCWTGKE